MKAVFTIMMLLLLNGNTIIFADELVVRHVRHAGIQDQRNLYIIDVLRLALEKTSKTEGPFRLELCESRMTQSRAIRSLAEQKYIDIVWSMTSRKREELLLPISIPLLKGLMGHRIFIIRKQDKDKFERIKSFDELKKMRAGQGHDWPDSLILRENGFRVVVGPNYNGLFEMLQAGRFDYFPRGANEPWAEVRAHKDKKLIVEETLLLQYPAPEYFFVNKNNTYLAERIERGLRKAIKDGSFDKLLHNHSSTKEIFKLAKLDKRKIFRLKNPLLTPETPLNDKGLWYTP